MLARLTRLPLRRCLHTRPPPPRPAPASSRLIVSLGASAVVASYLTWHLSSETRRIALDSPNSITTAKQPTLAAPSTDSASARPKPKKPSPAETVAPETTSEFASTSTFEPELPKAEPDPDAAPQPSPEDAPSTTDKGASGAFNPETGEINWDCPCLGGMADGPCGPQFKEAFSCFVYSEDEPKGINCVEKFQHMQDCFRAHPELYGEEIMDDDDEGDAVPASTGEETPENVVLTPTSRGTDSTAHVDANSRSETTETVTQSSPTHSS